MKPPGLRFGPLGPACMHICVDMQGLFARGAPWAVPWMEQILPNVVRIAAHSPRRTIFTRFLPPSSPDEAIGAWRRYYRKWRSVTGDQIGAEVTELLPALAAFVPPAVVVDKGVYSPWLDPALDALLGRGSVDTLLLTGGETDICVFATAMGAIDRGFRVVLVADALCSASDRSHDQLMDLCSRRFDTQVEVATADEVLDSWSRD